ncbi:MULTISPECIES: hypothetical protein [unclassified Breznakia]|uniref:hypothetical protein n=1 Tax=unclassified Breznakia TaxID=2623764 RepID=UPI0024762708|nr:MULTISPECIES: hypothetical protein [unclassified Breznakia]MDH6367532.1 hypothetical protein [Breznakia sp. PH1-1]MDH6404674.1 hypothetical protein [Breznakia sp. PF1-11]MDH6412362.1 hypothetical protein [Breznakia sp. PFB1-11]MDH6414700.1 hypothetical protein [Breznakia sp. PFB1-14]MDH6417055.1 hypothetical protein [Breznakia sp. PFB1-4]
MKNGLVDLNNHLFEEMERLNDDDLTPDELAQEIRRAKAMTDVSEQIINNASIVLKAEELKAEYGGRESLKLPEMLETNK